MRETTICKICNATFVYVPFEQKVVPGTILITTTWYKDKQVCKECHKKHE